MARRVPDNDVAMLGASRKPAAAMQGLAPRSDGDRRALHPEMRRLLCLLVVLATATATAPGTARAEPAPVLAPAVGHPFALAVNVPVAWPWSLAASAWVGLDEHHAIRANFARYRGPLWQILPNLLESDGEDDELGSIPADFGATTDLGLGWVYYPRRVLDGPSLEVGAMVRINRLRDRIDDQNQADEEQFTNVYGARVLVGWTWRVSDWWFIATSLGGSAGYERGRQKSFVGYSQEPFMKITRQDRVSRADASVEAYLRVGLAFGQ
jgi:hypothetical protein